MGRQAAGQNRSIVARAAAAPVREPLVLALGVLGSLLIVLLASRLALAEPVAAAPAGMIDAMPGAAVPAAGLPASIPAAAMVAPSLIVEPGVEPVAKTIAGPTSRPLDSLLVIPGLTPFRSEAEIADESIAQAVERGTNPDLEPVSAFRKRKTDLFRTERPVEIGEQEMLLRLRVRAKTRKAMSVELRF